MMKAGVSKPSGKAALESKISLNKPDKYVMLPCPYALKPTMAKEPALLEFRSHTV
jgi:hypothetical protein